MNKSIATLESFDPKYYLYLEGVSRYDWLNDKITYGGCNLKPEDLSGEFRVKETKLCEDVLSCLRALNLKQYQGLDFLAIKIVAPVSVEFELQIVSFAISLYEEILNSFKTTFDKDQEDIANPKNSARKRFATVWKYTNKKIAVEQIKLLTVLKMILENLKQGLKLREAYMARHSSLEKDEKEFIINRNRMASYLKLLSIYVK